MKRFFGIFALVTIAVCCGFDTEYEQHGSVQAILRTNATGTFYFPSWQSNKQSVGTYMPGDSTMSPTIVTVSTDDGSAALVILWSQAYVGNVDGHRGDTTSVGAGLVYEYTSNVYGCDSVKVVTHGAGSIVQWEYSN